VFYDEKECRDLPEALALQGLSLLKFNNRGAHIIKKLNVKTGQETERKRFGCAYEKIADCVPDIDGAVSYLESLGYKEFYLMGKSTGANKICVYNHYRPENKFSKYILVCGGDDMGGYYATLGKEKFLRLLQKAKQQIAKGNGEAIIKEILPEEIFSWKAFYDIANPDGDYNCFPFIEALKMAKLSTKPLFHNYKEINKPSLVIYGGEDEYCYGKVPEIVELLKSSQPEFKYQIIPGADHGFTGKKKELAEIITDWV
jgi:pimeloyl-ACP methyl ester carboxylesterase